MELVLGDVPLMVASVLVVVHTKIHSFVEETGTSKYN
jgi:hypothetical protein